MVMDFIFHVVPRVAEGSEGLYYSHAKIIRRGGDRIRGIFSRISKIEHFLKKKITAKSR